MAPYLIARRIHHSLTNDIRRGHNSHRQGDLYRARSRRRHHQLTAGQLEIGLTVLRRRLDLAIVHALHIGRELVEAGDGARRLLVGRFELLALGRVLVDLAEDLGGWKSVAMVRRYRKIVDERLDDVMDAFNENGEKQISER
ncbi:MAG: hypothetical protein OSB76_18830 [Alphaproteobacteria bacterium]|nr:hypothetical protein [Alphaproteobacteria bacterium]